MTLSKTLSYILLLRLMFSSENLYTYNACELNFGACLHHYNFSFFYSFFSTFFETLRMMLNLFHLFTVIRCRLRLLRTILSLMQIQTSPRSRSTHTGLLGEGEGSPRQIPLQHLRRPSRTTPTPNHRPSLQST